MMHHHERDHILAMKPGIELNALVAEKVMGWIVEFKFGIWGWMCRTPERNRWYNIPAFSAQIDDAWKVVEKMKIAIIPQSSSAPSEMSYMARYENCPKSDIKVFAETAPLAICRAALLALIEEVPNET